MLVTTGLNLKEYNPHAGGRRDSLAERPFAGAATGCPVKTVFARSVAASLRGHSFAGTGAYGNSIHKISMGTSPNFSSIFCCCTRMASHAECFYNPD